MSYQLFYPYPVSHNGLFKQRHNIINNHLQKFSSNDNFVFQEISPTTAEINNYMQMVKKNEFSKEYIGDLISDNDPWKFSAAFSDFQNIYKGVETIIDNDIKRSYFMTNSGGHHADNMHYELFCPLNHLFFAVEVLNYQSNFPQIAWVDIDAHFGNGDKIIFDKYKEKMKNESNNLFGASIQNDAGDLEEESYLAKGYDINISNHEFIELVRSVKPPENIKFLLLFFGTDIFKGDYGGNENTTQDIIPTILDYFEKITAKNNGYLIIFQTGGSNYENINLLVEEIIKR